MEILSQNQSQKTISIDGIQVRCDHYGRYCLNDLHRASGAAQKDQPRYFLENQQTKDLIEALIDSGIPLSPVEVVRGGLNQGTYVAKQIVYAYAMWIDAKFHLKVINTFDAIVTQKPKLPQSFAEALQLAADQARQLELAAPKVKHYDTIVAKDHLLTATQVGQKVGMSAVALNRILDELRVYNKAHKRSRVFNTWFEDQGLGELKQTTTGHSQPMFTTKGEAWVIEKLVSEGVAA